ncbi:MAG TPA: glutamate synthase-related protein [Spirochaetota bacterium]|nr:glutamate synthase-related protein [Spirochaetota bacterium]HNT10018.1 glutamate synthase-related protein [Spirochaetota bacterium]
MGIMQRNWSVIPPFYPEFDMERCDCANGCTICSRECSFGEISQRPVRGADGKVYYRPWANKAACGACQRCAKMCPHGAITIRRAPMHTSHDYWTTDYVNNIWKQSGNEGGVLLVGNGATGPQRRYFDHLMFDACQVTNPSIDPLREPMEIRTFLGRKPDTIDGDMGPQLALEVPIMFGAMSFGALNLRVHEAEARATKAVGTFWNTGEGGFHKSLRGYGANTIVQVASGRFGVSEEYLKSAAAVEIKIGQGAKPGIGGHLPGEKVGPAISETRMIPVGSDALSPAPHHDIYSIEDLRQLIFAIKEATEYQVPVSVKIAAVHNVAPIVSGIARAGADIIAIDGFRGGTGATPLQIRQNTGIPIELAIAAADQRLREEKIRGSVSLIASGGIQCSSDVLKALCLGADAVYVATPVLIALGCGVCQRCFSGKCAYGITTNKPGLAERIDVDEATEALTRLLRSWAEEIEELMGSMGISTIESLRGNRDRLRGVGLSEEELTILGVKHAGA